MKILVTGATGFIGSVLVRELIARGHRLRALVLPQEDAAGLERQGVEILRGDLTDAASIKGLCNGIETVFHLAGRVIDWGTRDLFYTAIYTATENLIKEAAGNAPRFIYISSVAAMGLGRHLKGVKETDAPQKSGIPYNDAKVDAEKLVMDYHRSGKTACAIVRPDNVTGPGSVWVREIIEKMQSLFVPLIDHGQYSASLVYVDNLVDGMILAGTREIAVGKAYHFRDDWNVTWKQYITDLGAFIGKRPLGSFPFWLAWTMGSLSEKVFDPFHWQAPFTRLSAAITGRDLDIDTSLAKNELGWRTRVSYPQAMEKIGAWVRERYGSKK